MRKCVLLMLFFLTSQTFSQSNCQKEIYNDKYVSTEKFVCKMILSEMRQKIKFTKISLEKNPDPNFVNGFLWEASYKKSNFFFIKSDNPELGFLTFATIQDTDMKVMSRGIRIGMSKKDFMIKMKLKSKVCDTFSVNNDSSFIEFSFLKDKLTSIKIDMGS